MTVANMTYQPSRYWGDLVTGNGSVSNVGHAALGHYNTYAYPLRLEALSRALSGVPHVGGKVFDAGFGEGVYLKYWQARGVGSIAGLDFSRRAVEAGLSRHPHFDLRQGDLSNTADFAGFGSFDIVTAVDVLYHIVDDAAWLAAVGNLVALVKSGGLFVFSDKFPANGPVQPKPHVRRRSLAMWQTALASHGFAIVRRVPVFVLMDDPITYGSHPWLGRLSHIQWKVLTKLVRMARRYPWLHRAVAAVVARLQLIPERVLVRLLSETPNLELAVCRRVSAAAW